ncbi:hypothetical protein WJX81_007588 [Elliptochloris bilobata]|uniref:Uncharacterized protein n=1 Tax=Elliptochloris bilobata TaxID=381761 RepID=A0AAW1RMX8_9CHLO
MLQGDELFGSSQLPQLPRNAKYIFHENRCFDWGTFGWAIAERKVDTSRYSYIIFMNSSVRGPFLPAYWPAGVHWSDVLTTRINNDVKLVGATISCEPAWLGGNTANEKRQVPHVQSYVIATDQVGLEVLMHDGRVFQCYEDMADTIFHSELGGSSAILAANFTIDSLMLRYQGIDWTDTANWNCNAGLNPYAEHTYDGVPLNPLEVMFVKVKDFQLEGDWMSTHLAATYGRWLEAQVQEDCCV